MVALAWPLPCGEYGDDLRCFTQYFFVMARTSLFMKSVPLSVTILWGMLKRHMMCSHMKLAITAPVAFLKGMASTHLVKYSVATKIQIYPTLAGLMGPMRSSPQVWNGHGVVMFCKVVRCE